MPFRKIPKRHPQMKCFFPENKVFREKIFSVEKQNLRFRMVKATSDTSVSQSTHYHPVSPNKPSNYRKYLIITVVVLEILLFLGTIAFGTAAIISGMHMLWIGIIPCALAMIGLVGGLLCVLKPSTRNIWTFNRPQQAKLPKTYHGSDYVSGVYRLPIARWR